MKKKILWFNYSGILRNSNMTQRKEGWEAELDRLVWKLKRKWGEIILPNKNREEEKWLTMSNFGRMIHEFLKVVSKFVGKVTPIEHWRKTPEDSVL